MSDMKCPFCGDEMKLTSLYMGGNHRYSHKHIGLLKGGNDRCPFDGETLSSRALREIHCMRAALGVAQKTLQELKDVIACPPDMLYVDCVSMYADGALQEITTALEQRAPVVTHNKIEFPEYNDGLLEEFDKQFFENGQDDDLTETFLEQKDI